MKSKKKTQKKERIQSLTKQIFENFYKKTEEKATQRSRKQTYSTALIKKGNVWEQYQQDPQTKHFSK